MSMKILKRRIRSVQNTKQITKAMELVAASKLRHVQLAALEARSYSQIAASILRRSTSSMETSNHPYFKSNLKADKNLYIVFASDKGLAGSFISGLQRSTTALLKEDFKNSITSEIIVFGRRAAKYFANLNNCNLIAVYENIADIPESSVFEPTVDLINKNFRNGTYKEVKLIYSKFITTIKSKPETQVILPIVHDELKGSESSNKVYEFEPTADEVVEVAAQLYLQSQIMQAKLDSAASEQAMRMMAMNNASRNADELLDNFKLDLNASRQSNITQQIIEVSSGSLALN